MSENYEDFYLSNFINLNYSLFLHDKYIYFFYISNENDEKLILYKIGTNLNIVTEIQDYNFSKELYFHIDEKKCVLIDKLNNYYLNIDKYGKYNKIINHNFQNIVSSSNNYQKLNYSYNQLFSEKMCLEFYKNIIYLKNENNDNNVKVNLDQHDKNENLVLDLNRNSTKKDRFICR